MIKRIVDISEPAYLHLKNNQLQIEHQGQVVGQVPVEDLGVLILQHPAVVMTQALLVACQLNNVVTILCDAQHLPYSALLPISEGNKLHTKELKLQISAKKTTKNRLWKQVVRQKIEQQAETLSQLGRRSVAVERLSRKVKSGDKENYEAQAAQKYWRLLMGKEFRRNPKAEGVNALLNYGYAIIRALVARAVVASGLHPSLGIHHHNQYNSLCLADDLMEPFRPWVDYRVHKMVEDKQVVVVDTEAKQMLLGILGETVLLSGKPMSFMVASHQLMAQLKRAYRDRNLDLIYPMRIWD